MFPFAILGFVMKPLQLKGVLLCIYSSSFNKFLTDITKRFVITGFFHAESKIALTAGETAVLEVEGADHQFIMFLLIVSFPFDIANFLLKLCSDSGVLNGKDGSFSLKDDVRNSTIHKSSK